MTYAQRNKYLRILLAASGLLFLLGAYPLMHFWQSGWGWQEVAAYATTTVPQAGMSPSPKMIIALYEVLGVFLLLASFNPRRHISLIAFVIWSSLAHGITMAVMAINHFSVHAGHLLGDVPAMIILAIVLAWLCPDALFLRFSGTATAVQD